MIDMKQLKENVSNKIMPHPQSAADTKNRKHSNAAEAASVAAAIGSSITINGEVSGNEDLIIQGHVKGNINLKGHCVIIRENGRVQADIHASHIVVEGELKGDMHGEEKVIIRKTGNVHGNIVSPRVTLEDGALFKGSIEMEPRQISVVENKPANQPGKTKVQ